METLKNLPIWAKILIAIGLLLTLPLWVTAIGIGVGTVALFLCLLIFILLVCALLISLLLLFGGQVVWLGVGSLFSGLTWVGVFAMGVGFLMLAAGILGILVSVWVYGVFVPWLYRSLNALCHRILDKKEETA
ncbi:MAG: hypothetical protein ACK5ML_14525 [Lachnospiraceae bacterium]